MIETNQMDISQNVSDAIQLSDELISTIKKVFLCKLDLIKSINDYYLPNEYKEVYSYEYENIAAFPVNRQFRFEKPSIENDGVIEVFPEISTNNEETIFVPIKEECVSCSASDMEVAKLSAFGINGLECMCEKMAKQTYNIICSNLYETIKRAGLQNNDLLKGMNKTDLNLYDFVPSHDIGKLVKNIKIAINTLIHKQCTEKDDMYFILCDEKTAKCIDHFSELFKYAKEKGQFRDFDFITHYGYFIFDQYIDIPIFYTHCENDDEGYLLVGRTPKKEKFKGYLSYIKSINTEVKKDAAMPLKTEYGFNVNIASSFINCNKEDDYICFKIDYSK